MRRIRAVVHRLPWWALFLLALAGIGTCYLGVRRLQFEYHLRSARQAISREAFEEAGEQLAHCLRIDPRSGQAHFLAARTARRSDQLDFAEEELTTCDDLGWAAADVNAERAMLAVQHGEFNDANEASLRSALAEDHPDRFVALEALAQGYMRTYRLTQALDCRHLLGHLPALVLSVDVVHHDYRVVVAGLIAVQ